MRTINLIIILIACFSAQSYSQLNIAPIAYYKLDGNANDEVAGNNGIIYGHIDNVPDRNGSPGGAMEFDGNDYIKIPASRALNNITSEFSVTGWINFSSSCRNNLFWATILCKGDSRSETDNNPQFRLQFTKVTFSIKSNMIDSKGCVPWDMQSVFSYDSWHFFAATYDGSTAKMFLDGQQIFSYKLDQRLNSNTSPLYIGRDIPGADEYFCGQLDDIRIFDKALSNQEVYTIFKYPQTPVQTSPLSTIHFILFTDTEDSRVGTSCKETNRYFKNTFVPQLEDHTGMKVKTYYHSGSSYFKLSNLNSTINNLRTSSNDVIFFYFSGHGYNKGNSNYPTITLGVNGNPVSSRQKDLIDIYNDLRRKNHRLLIVMAEACNKIYASRNNIRTGHFVGNFTPYENNSRHFRELFVNSNGDYLMSSSSKNQLSHLVTGQPGYFTCGFRDAFAYYTDKQYSGTATWEKIFNKTKNNTSNSAGQSGYTQTPQWCKDNNCN